MKYTATPLKYSVFITCFLFALLSHAFDANVIEKQADSSIEALYHRLSMMPNSSSSKRVAWVSRQFLGMPYVLGSLGEGATARYDQFPLYRVDAFDCETYVTTVLALALAHSPASFQQCIKKIRYKNATVSYLQRNHFTGLDWNQNNQQNKILKDITGTIKDQNNHSVAQYADTIINKPHWYAYKTIAAIRLENNDPINAEKRLAELKNKGAHLEIAREQLPYLPFTALFSPKNTVNSYLFAQIPHGAIIEIVRPNWDLRQKIGTALSISHLGFAIRNKGELYFREASSEYGKVIDVPLIDYLKKAQNSPTIKGINVQIIGSSKTPCSLVLGS